MTPHRTSAGGHLRFDRVFPGVGRIARSSGTSDRAQFRKRDGVLTDLFDNAQLPALRAFQHGQVTIQELIEAQRAGLLKHDALLPEMAKRRSLWSAVDATLPLMGRAPSTRIRYEVSLKALRTRARGSLGDKATVGDLAGVDWRTLSAAWLVDRSAADWNLLRRAISRFLSVLLDDKHHPFRREAMKHFPIAPEVPREPELSAEAFWQLVAAAPEYAQPCYVTLAITGMRVGEYLALGLEHLHHDACSIAVGGSKTAGSSAVVPVDPDYWNWIVAAVPSPLGYKWLRLNFLRAAKAIGRDDLRLHDLRHLYAQLASDAGAPTAQVQAALRHASPAMTRRYEKRRDRGQVARLVGGALKPRQVG